MQYKVGLLSAVIWILVTVRTAAVVYDDGIITEIDPYNFLDDNYVDTGHTEIAYKNEDPVKELLMYKMLKTLATSATDQPDLLTRSTWSSLDNKMIPSSSQLKEHVDKRREKNTKARKTFPPRPQPKWKIKKEKVVGSQVLCYFKLCAFRPPV